MSQEEDERTLAKEFESWKGFEYALRKPNATLFNKMLTEYLENEEYATASKTREPTQYSTESLFMALIFQQQKTYRMIED
jgi:hypothetical protein